VKVDLHVHSNYSDGTFTPEQLVDSAIQLGIGAISITDHDNVISYEIAKEYIKQKNAELELIPGVEINTICKNEEIHVLGYYMDMNNKAFKEMLVNQQHARINQTHKIVELLNKKEGINITFENIKNYVTAGGSIGRPHIAKALVHVGGVMTVMEAYSKYINNSSPVYIQRETVSTHDAVEIIYEAGGIPVLAHPCDIQNAEKFVTELMSYGLRGVEAYHRKHSPAMVEYYSSIAEKYDLIVTGGSDFHAPNMSNQVIMGKNFVPDWVLGKLKNEKNRIEIASI
jgi:hypothetical protein